MAAIAAGLGLASACGGRAGDADDAAELVDSDQVADMDESTTAAARLVPFPTPTSPPMEARPQAMTSPPMAAPPQAMNAAEAPPREEELCYTPNDLSDYPAFEIILPKLPAQSFDANGCVSGNYAAWLDSPQGGSCSYDANPAVVRGERCCYVLSATRGGCGRPLVIDGRSRVASVRTECDGASSGVPRSVLEIDPEIAERVGREWLEDALLEHASIASFAAFALSLMAVGAPADLLEQCQRAGLDEAEHARLCFALARSYSNRPCEAGALDLSGLVVATKLEEVAVRTLLDGCIEETIAALTAAAQLEVAKDGEARAALERIAEDETRHAELAWQFVAWAVATGGPSVARALRVAAEAKLQAAPMPDGSPDHLHVEHLHLEQLHAAGRLTLRERALVRESAIHSVIRPALAQLSGTGSRISRMSNQPPSV